MTLQVTTDAGAHLKSILDNAIHDTDQVLRLTRDSQKTLALVLDYERTGDEVVFYETEKVMVVGKEVGDLLVIDTKSTPVGNALVVRRPQPASNPN
jgi:hypothetical protein